MKSLLKMCQLPNYIPRKLKGEKTHSIQLGAMWRDMSRFFNSTVYAVVASMLIILYVANLIIWFFLPEVQAKVNYYIFGGESVWVSLFVLVLFAVCFYSSVKDITNKKTERNMLNRYLGVAGCLSGFLYLGYILLSQYLVKFA